MTLRTVHFRKRKSCKRADALPVAVPRPNTARFVRTPKRRFASLARLDPSNRRVRTAGGQWPVSRCIIDTSRSAHCAMTRTPISSWAYPSPHCRQPEQQQEQRLGRAHHPTLGIRAHLPHQCQRSSRRLPPVPTELPTRTRTRFRSHHSIDDRWAREGRSS